jgi:hypothetical protein
MAAKLASPQKRPSKKRGLLKVASLGVAGLIAGFLSGCSSVPTVHAATSFSHVIGNWQFSSSSANAAALPGLAGSLTVDGSQVSGILHPLASPYDCVTYKTSFPVTGSIDSLGNLSLTSNGFSGGNLTLTGRLSDSQNTLTNASYSVTKGVCALLSSHATGTQFNPIAGTYSGTIHSDTGKSLAVSTLLTQSTLSDNNGTYHLQGNSTLGSMQPCLPTAPTVSNSTVTGSSLNAIYTEASGSNLITVVVDATFNPDASSLTLNSYHITGGACDGDSGHGILTRQ